MNIEYYDYNLSARDYNLLRQSVGWSVSDEVSSKKAIDNSLYICSAHDNGMTVGSGRVVGDGVLAFSIQDVMVLPAYQRHFGIGKKIMHKILNYIKNNASPEADIYCMSAKNREEFYIKLGFVERPTSQLGAGMVLPYEILQSMDTDG
ncbi:GNAT family N-acetyltransferase [uncultured Cedecea sp.]|uniref:GNAT family N-acetyltransferase n=1 Tax=uncultured Cedecea sp. TaxID=988762 RepID=UPI002622CB4D|nr:GNAT family N-acetyltransferase [uncultured Cedecea sp.]